MQDQGQIWNAGPVRIYASKKYRPKPQPEPRPCANSNCDQIHRRRSDFCCKQCAEAARPRDYSTPANKNKNHLRRTRTQYTDVTAQDIKTLLANRTYCPECKKRMTEAKGQHQKTIDHIIPINIGGTHTLGNLRVICFDCNVRRPKDGSDLIDHQPTIWATDQVAAEASMVLRRRKAPKLPRAYERDPAAQLMHAVWTQRARAAAVARRLGMKWEEIATALGYGSAGAAYNSIALRLGVHPRSFFKPVDAA